MTLNLEIYDDTKPVVKPPVFLKLLSTLSDIKVVVVNEKGRTLTSGHLLRFNNDGSVFTYPGVASELGFQLDDEGRIKVQ